MKRWLAHTRARYMMGWVRPAAAAILSLPLLVGGGSTTVSAAPAVLVSIQWLRVDTHHPTTMYVGGTLNCPDAKNPDAQLCPGIWAARSTDGGNTWSQLNGPLGFEPSQEVQGYDVTASLCADTVDPFLVAGDGVHLYTTFSESCGGPHGSAGILRSADRGAHWERTGATDLSNEYYDLPTTSPVSARRLYAVAFGNCDGCATVEISNDAGASWHDASSPAPADMSESTRANLAILGIVADPVQPNTIYANLGPYSRTHSTTLATRSTDTGNTWTTVITPTTSPPLRTLSVSTDIHEPGLLVGRTTDPGLANRRYLSNDQGRTWRASACPGIHDGECPPFTFDNVFGNGASYALFNHALYTFRGAGPAGARLKISGQLPAGSVLDAGAGTGPGDPVYLLVRGINRHVSGLLYRSTDAGKSWQQLSAGVLPTMAPPSTAPGTLLIPTTHHSVAAPFAATYRRLGLQIIGYPITEAYYEGDTLTQVFEHLRLELRGGKVHVGSLGRDVFIYQVIAGDPALSDYDSGSGTVDPIPTSSTARYFPKTKHTLRGDLLRFWQQHGGMAVFGAPITEVVRGANGDGSGRKYQMQYFENARLERHPENTNSRYAIQLGLLGSQWLHNRGWQ